MYQPSEPGVNSRSSFSRRPSATLAGTIARRFRKNANRDRERVSLQQASRMREGRTTTPEYPETIHRVRDVRDPNISCATSRCRRYSRRAASSTGIASPGSVTTTRWEPYPFLRRGAFVVNGTKRRTLPAGASRMSLPAAAIPIRTADERNEAVTRDVRIPHGKLTTATPRDSRRTAGCRRPRCSNPSSRRSRRCSPGCGWRTSPCSRCRGRRTWRG